MRFRIVINIYTRFRIVIFWHYIYYLIFEKFYFLDFSVEL